jgi:hypothetical protein
LAAYAAGSVAVGELLTFLDEEDAYAGVPVICHLQATADTLPDPGPLPVLLSHPRVIQLPLPPAGADWLTLAAWLRLLGDPDVASASYEVDRRLVDQAGGVYVVTSVPERYADLPTIAL